MSGDKLPADVAKILHSRVKSLVPVDNSGTLSKENDENAVTETRMDPPSKMRKQYHFRPSESGLMAWDVDRLIALSKDLPRIQTPLSAIRELDEPFWFAADDTPTCRAVVAHVRLIDAADLTFPIILSSDGRVMDGMHRVGKALLMGRSTIEAVQFSMDPEPDYIGVHPDELPYDEVPH